MANPTMDDKVSQVSGGQADRVAAAGASNTPASTDLINQLVQLQGQQEQLQQAPQASMQKELTSLPGILALLGGGTAMALGGQGTQEGGAAFLNAFMGQRQGAVQAHNQGLAAQKAALNESINQQRTRLTTLLQTQPDMFIDPVTGAPAVDPRLLGYAATGMMLPIDPTTNHALKNRLKTREEQFELGKKMFTDGDTADVRIRGLDMIGAAHGIKWNDQFYQVAATGNEQAMYEHMMQEGYFTPTSVLQAMLYAQQNGLSLVEVADTFVADKTRGLSSGGRPTMASAQLEALDLYAQRLAMNPEYNDPALSQEDRWALAFPAAGDQKYVELLRKGFTEGGISSETMMRQLNSNMAIIGTLESMGGGVPESFLKPHGLTKDTPDWQSKLAVKLTQWSVPAMAGLDRQQAQTNTVTARDELLPSLLRVPEIAAFGEGEVRRAALLAVLAAKKANSGEFGVLDREAFAAELEGYKNNPELLLDYVRAVTRSE